MFTLFADLIARQLDAEWQHVATDAALTDARAVAALREQFIAVLGHDLRNPLSAMINDVLDFARARLGGGLDVVLKPEVALGSLLSQVVAELQIAHEGRTIVSSIDVPCRAVHCGVRQRPPAAAAVEPGDERPDARFSRGPRDRTGAGRR